MVDSETIQFQTRKAYGATANSIIKKIDVKDPISHIILSMTASKSAGTTSTVAEVLAQMATKIEVKVDGRGVYVASAADTYHGDYFWYKQNMPSMINNDSTTDNQIVTAGIIIPFGRVWPGAWLTADPLLALETVGRSIETEVTFPADAGELDTRLLTQTAIIHPGMNSRGFIERQVRTLTPPATGFDKIVDLPHGPGVSLYDLEGFQTTALNAGSTSDVTGIEQIKLEQGARETSINTFNWEQASILNGQVGDTDMIDDKYGYITWDGRLDLKDVKRLDIPSRFNVNAGDTNLFRLLPGILRMKPAQRVVA